jgi:WD repeat-containing protein 1 (actin-interacting protein 1)
VRYSPDGSLFASAGFDGKIYLYDGATSELKGEVITLFFLDIV